MKPSKLLVTLILLVIFVYYCAPYPIVQEHYSSSNYAKYSYQQIDKFKPSFDTSPLKAGVAKVDITPGIGVPMGGYGSITSRPNSGHSQKVYARAIALSNDTQTVIILNAEFLLPLPFLIDEVVKKSGLKREQIYFTATHTHSGPGGYTKKLSSEFALGNFHDEYFSQLVSQLSTAIKRSQENLHNVTIHYTQTTLDPHTSQNIAPSRFDENESPIPHQTTLHFLSLDTDEKTLALIATVNAHPTVYKSINTKINGDYPGILATIMEQRCQCIAAFAAGAVGGNSSPQLDNNLALEQTIKNYAEKLYAKLTKDKLQSKTYQASEVSISADILAVKLPDSVFHINENWKLNPRLFKLLLHDENTYIHVLRIGDLVFAGFPADYSEQLANKLIRWGNNNKTYIWPTSFNGDYIGYIMTSAQYEFPHYTTRDMNFFGKWTGDYMNDLTKAYLLQRKPTL